MHVPFFSESDMGSEVAVKRRMTGFIGGDVKNCGGALIGTATALAVTGVVILAPGSRSS